MSGAFEEGKKAVKGECSKFGGTGWEYCFLDAYQTVVIPSEKREVAEWRLCVTYEAPHLKGTWVWRKGRCRELVENRTGKITKKRGTSHEPGDAGPLVWRTERN